MRWPWSAPETRASAPYTDAIVDAIIAQAGGNVTATADATAALEACAGKVALVFASANVRTASSDLARALAPELLGLIGHQLIRHGESIHVIEVDRDGLRILPAGSWDIRGGADPESWWYRADLFGPSGNVTRFRPAASVVHCRYQVDPARPYTGIGPLGWARLTARLHAETEAALADESSGPRGHLLPVPATAQTDEEGNDQTAGLKVMIKSLRGRTALVETTSGSWGQDPKDAPRQDWRQQRLGAEPPAALGSLRSDSARAVFGACQVPPVLFDSTAAGTARREGIREFYAGAIVPLARKVSRELSTKFGTDVALAFDAPAFEDRIGRAGVAAKLAGLEGMELDRALELAGLAGG